MKLVASNGIEYLLDKPETSLGRGAHNDIQLNDPKASTNHALIRHQGNEYVLQDLNSTNGVFVNANRIYGAHNLRHGDQIRVGDTIFTVQATAQVGGGTMVDHYARPAAPPARPVGPPPGPYAGPPPPAMPMPMGPAYPGEIPNRQGFCIAGMILGILSIPGAFIPICGGIAGIVGLILSAVGMRTSKGRGMAIAGLVTSIIGLVGAICYFVYSLAVLGTYDWYYY